MDNSIIIALITAGGGAAVAGIFQVVTVLINNRKKKNDKEETISEGVMVLLQDRIKFLAKHYIADTTISPEDLEDLMRMHNVYKNLGGNGYLDTLMAAVKDLPLTR